MDGLLPLLAVAHDDGPALLVIGGDAHLEHVVSSLYAQLLVNLKLHREAVAVPSEPSDDMMPRCGCISSDNVLCSMRDEGQIDCMGDRDGGGGLGSQSDRVSIDITM